MLQAEAPRPAQYPDWPACLAHTDQGHPPAGARAMRLVVKIPAIQKRTDQKLETLVNSMNRGPNGQRQKEDRSEQAPTPARTRPRAQIWEAAADRHLDELVIPPSDLDPLVGARCLRPAVRMWSAAIFLRTFRGCADFLVTY